MQHPSPDPTPIAFADSAYGDFARVLRTPALPGEVWRQPALVRLRGGGTDEPRARASLAAFADLAARGQISVEAWDVARLGLDGGPAPAEDQLDDAIPVSWPMDEAPEAFAARHADVFEVLQLERPILAPDAALALEPDAAAAPCIVPHPATPIIAVIDDGIGFLNARFCRPDPGAPGRLRTRFHAVWLQAFRSLPDTDHGTAYVESGRVLNRATIDALLALGPRLDEGEVYRVLNRDLLDPAATRPAEQGFSHGTHILDTAAGADPWGADPALHWPLLAVQLPPEAVDNTAGTQLEPCILRGLRWILRQAEAMHDRAPLIVNISFATFAGPKDGTKAIEALTAQALARWRARTGRGARVVFSFGNARLTRQAARLELAPGAPQTLDWRLLPDNAAPAYMEIRPSLPADLARLTLRLRAPGDAAVQSLGPLAPDHMRPLFNADGTLAGRFYHIGPRHSAPGVTTPAHAVLALGPSLRGSPAHADPGAWTMELVSAGSDPLTLRLEVQRGDTPFGHRRHGRQTYLDHPLAEEWDAETAAYAAPGPGCPITRAGTHSSFVTAASEAIVTVAAARGDALLPCGYSAEGSGWTIPGPSLAAQADRGAALNGRVGAGTFSGGARTLDGTSVAAALATRTLAQALEAGVIAPLPAADDAARLVARYGTPADPHLAHRLGAGVIGLTAQS